ncbi:DUF5683 domain-containing protein [Moheibacter lacus]|uniref:DUF5683 domain-containing protein n=1 Tax=Moheibacter lacus TaxID=2745851 RepID=A0A838ZTJ5_9FLAO|nr:DUF5683 domain-containing protein [Moheibacter lacus]MBA5630259.1 hypothetical protein [Moheibacter lacus]
MKNQILTILLILPILAFSQVENDSVQTTEPITEIVAVNETEKLDTIDYLTMKNPIRASLYSAILPGMGQIYNKKWWKAPLVWGILGTGAGFIIYYNNQYKEYRGYYLDKLYGYELENPTLNNMSVEQLANIQDDRKRTRDYAIALTALGYILNIVDATVDAHLYGIKKDPDLSFQPIMLQNLQTAELAMGFGVSYKF